ncbi:aminotransferase class I/II-fold pyridoxal phosphate-dependent enzyme [Rhizobium sp. KVB221]|uniref:Aminotransferase class I/II-fold pyridoxal phosphate-dependent enzyme n=1 Tax=Rhizobium setariae TaxID=2801340 RepID=A0A937CPT8_9HYPH|nr:aminotransferase class I/II-fold pyridoxal phosphate-dependent enzyme [Rhizobium setariae]MBL0375306.1 aminotransferase class I/II-fold pyridoxal phosphate-dependent enzyme [Rhizobium setariae]
MFENIPGELRTSLPAVEKHNHPVNLLSRWDESGDWWEQRVQFKIDPYQKYSTGRVGSFIEGAHRDGTPFSGNNFASQDYLSLSSHPKLIEAAKAAIDTYGLHSAGSAALMGNTALSVALERRLETFLGYDDVVVFPIGWAAGYGAVKTLVKPTDHVVIDILAHACLQEAARDATDNVHMHSHLNLRAVESRLARIRREDETCGILVVTETLFSMDSDLPNIPELQEICRRFNATLLVDCAHDLGALGETGRGKLEDFGIVGGVDILVGAFSKSFASMGGFVASNSKGLRFGLRGQCGPSTFTNAMSPIQAATILAALDIIESEEGAERRRRLMANSIRLREGLEAEGFEVLGKPSAVVPMLIGDILLARLMTRYAVDFGGIVNLVEHPAVARNACRWRLQVMADHTDEQIDAMIEVAGKAREMAEMHCEWLSANDNSEGNVEVVPAVAEIRAAAAE